MFLMSSFLIWPDGESNWANLTLLKDLSWEYTGWHWNSFGLGLRLQD